MLLSFSIETGAYGLCSCFRVFGAENGPVESFPGFAVDFGFEGGFEPVFPGSAGELIKSSTTEKERRRAGGRRDLSRACVALRR